jgi:hypothetical protein
VSFKLCLCRKCWRKRSTEGKAFASFQGFVRLFDCVIFLGDLILKDADFAGCTCQPLPSSLVPERSRSVRLSPAAYLLKQRQLEALEMALPNRCILREGAGDVGIDHASNHFLRQPVR